MAEQMMLKQVRDVLEYVRSTCFTLEDGSRVFCGDMADAIDAHLNAAKGEAVAWRYRFAGSQEYKYATAGEGLVDARPLVESQPLYTHPASPDVELCSRILAMNEMAQALFGVILDITSGDYYESNNVDIRSEPWSWLFNDASEFAGEWNEMIRSIKLSSMAAREGGE